MCTVGPTRYLLWPPAIVASSPSTGDHSNQDPSRAEKSVPGISQQYLYQANLGLITMSPRSVPASAASCGGCCMMVGLFRSSIFPLKPPIIAGTGVYGAVPGTTSTYNIPGACVYPERYRGRPLVSTD